MYTVTCELKGGLGNQLFQIFNLISYSIDNNMIFKFPIYKGMYSLDKKTLRKNYLNCFIINQKNNIINTNNIKNYHTLVENGSFMFKKLKHKENNNIKLVGYFQSYHYFCQNYDLIKKIISLDDIITNTKNKYTIKPDSISLHFRIGDYKCCNAYPIMQSSYYVNCINYIIDKDKDIKNIYYFFEKNDIEKINVKLKKIKRHFPDLNFINLNNIEHDWEEMILMSLCKHNIIANSTFSWWGAYLNNNENKIVCYPDKWIHTKKLVDENLFPRSWTIINS